MSERERRMLEHIPEVYAELIDMQAMAQGGAAVIDQLEKNMDDTLNQVFIETATWGLEKREKELDIVPVDMSYSIRRANIKQKENAISPANKNMIERAVNRYLANPRSKVQLIEGEYAFDVTIMVEDLVTGKQRLVDLVEEIKPAHLEALFDLLIWTGLVELVDDSYTYPVFYKTCGEFSGEKGFSQIDVGEVNAANDSYGYVVDYPVAQKGFSQAEMTPIEMINDSYGYSNEYLVCGEFYAEGE